MGGQPEYANYGEPKPRNILGIVGFVFSVTCLVAPLGVLLSMFALLKRPRGFAIAGVLVGAVFSIPHGVVAASYLRLALLSPAELTAETTGVEASAVLAEAAHHFVTSGSLPTSADQLDLEKSTATDYWGNPYRLEITGTRVESIKVFSAGPDGVFDTDDDVEITDAMINGQRKKELIALYEKEIDPAAFDRPAMRKELNAANSDFVKSILRNIFGDSEAEVISPTDQDASDSGEDSGPSDPATPEDPATPDSP